MWLNAIFMSTLLLLFLKEVLKWVFRCSVYMTNDHIVYVTCIYIMRCKAGWSRLGNHNQPDKHNCRWYTYCHWQPNLLASIFLEFFFFNLLSGHAWWTHIGITGQFCYVASMFLRSFEGKIFFCGFEQSSVSYIYVGVMALGYIARL